MKPPLILGTAEFNPKGYWVYPPVEPIEIVRILYLAKQSGINMIDTAESYDCHNIIKQAAEGFCIYTKTRDWKINLDWGRNELRGILYHYGPTESSIDFPHIHRWINLGASVYDLEQLPRETTRIIQVPLNIEDRRFEGVFKHYRTVFVRSIFKKGELLKSHSIKECLNYVSQFRPDGIIVGVRSAKELSQILETY